MAPVAAVLGVDPGRSGGGSAVLAINARRVTAVLAVHWTARGEQFKVRWVTRTPDGAVTLYVANDVYGIAALGTAIGALAGTAAEAWGAEVLAVVSEGPYLGENVQTALQLARTGAAIEATAAARLSTSRPVRTRTIAPTSWRKILGVSAPDREAAKQKSLRFVPLLVDGVADVLVELGLVDHVTDAAGVAAVGVRCAAWEGEPADWTTRVTGSSGTKKKTKTTPVRPRKS